MDKGKDEREGKRESLLLPLEKNWVKDYFFEGYKIRLI